jgi:hypothetical protein
VPGEVARGGEPAQPCSHDDDNHGVHGSRAATGFGSMGTR